MTSITLVAACLFLLVGTTPTASFLLSSPTTLSSGASRRTKLSAAEAGVDVKDLLYQEQENLIIQRGELEEGFFSNAKPLEASVVNVRGDGKAGGFGKSSSSNKTGSKVEGKAYAKILKKEGVIRIDNVLSSNTADELRDYLYNLRQISEKDVSSGKFQPIERFANVLLRTNRCDLTIPVGADHPIVTSALYETLRKSPIGAIISSIFGNDAILHEFSCLMSDVGSQRQVIHPDTPFIEGKGPVLYTCFIALQDVTLDMGPTTWLPRTHTKEVHDAFTAGTESKDELLKKQRAVLGLLPKGSCGIFDSRLLHCGSANKASDPSKSRALFYFSFKNPTVGYTGNPASIRAELGSAEVTLGALMDDLDLFGKGEGSPLIDMLGTKLR